MLPIGQVGTQDYSRLPRASGIWARQEIDTMTEKLNLKLDMRFVEQFLELWVNPEIERRKTKGILPENFVLYAAQVIMNFGAPAQIRLNKEIKAVLVGDFSRKVEVEEQVSVDAFENIKEILLTRSDPNAGHFTMIRHRESWLVGFDFRYNTAVISEHLDAARQFLDSVSVSFTKGHLRVVADNLFSAVELMAKGLLLMHDEVLLTANKHGAVSSRYNQWGNLGNTDKQYTQLLNKLSNIRSSSRYLQREFNLTDKEAKNMIEIAENMYADLKAQLPKKY